VTAGEQPKQPEAGAPGADPQASPSGHAGPPKTGADATSQAKKPQKRTQPTRQGIDSDKDPAGGDDSATFPGIDAFRAIGTIAPFLALVTLYAQSLYSRRKSTVSKVEAFTEHHSGSCASPTCSTRSYVSSWFC
jgi:hypothetical protein